MYLGFIILKTEFIILAVICFNKKKKQKKQKQQRPPHSQLYTQIIIITKLSCLTSKIFNQPNGIAIHYENANRDVAEIYWKENNFYLMGCILQSKDIFSMKSMSNRADKSRLKNTERRALQYSGESDRL